MKTECVSLILVLLLVLANECLASEAISNYFEKNNCDVSNLEIVDNISVDQLIAHYQIFYIKQEEINSSIDLFLKENYNQILNVIYLSHVLHQEELPNNTLQRLKIFKEKSQNNSLPYFLLSYYYFKNNSLEKSLSYLKAANKIYLFDGYTSEIKEITKSYLIENQKNLFCSYNYSIFTINNFPLFLFKLSKSPSIKSNVSFREELLAFSKIFEENSDNLFEKIVCLAVQLQLINKETSPNIHASISKKRTEYIDAMNRLNDIVDEFNEEELFSYMESVYQYGELAAIDKILDKVKK